MVDFLSSPVESTRNETITVGTITKVVAETRNSLAKRKVILMRNTSTDVTSVITVVPAFYSATASAGIVLQNGESFSDTTESGYEAFQGQYSAICSNANGILSIFER